MSLIYNALSKLEKKIENDTPNMLGKMGADQYVLSTKSSGMPGWVKILLVFCVLGVVAGWLAMTVLKEQLQTLQDNLKTSKTPLAAQSVQAGTKQSPTALPLATAPAIVAHDAGTMPAPVLGGDNEQAVASVVPSITQSIPSLESRLSIEKGNVSAVDAEKNLKATTKNQGERTAVDSDVKPVATIPENEVSLVEIKLESSVANPPPDASLTRPANLVDQKKGREPAQTRSIKMSKSAVAEQQLAAKNAMLNEAAAHVESMNVQEISRLTQSIKSAISAGKKSEADDMIAQLEKRLEPESLTLLHLKAWRQMQGGNPQQAISLYQQISERNPDDETAAINLALLLWRSGQQTEARKVINTIAERKPDSEIVQSYYRQFGVQK
ncbi:tetratricopeptide repeat protein [Undibacterium sp. Ji22W]|uniref:tetratricopeptide repeat protein n=1 Tax=Undibacterium sp. Ji22W TaxID=3413038 RepID=UPI003BF40FDE